MIHVPCRPAPGPISGTTPSLRPELPLRRDALDILWLEMLYVKASRTSSVGDADVAGRLPNCAGRKPSYPRYYPWHQRHRAGLGLGLRMLRIQVTGPVHQATYLADVGRHKDRNQIYFRNPRPTIKTVIHSCKNLSHLRPQKSWSTSAVYY